MHFTLFDFGGVGATLRRQQRPQGLEELDDRLLQDIGYTREGLPIDPDRNPLPPARTNAVERLAPALLLLLSH